MVNTNYIDYRGKKYELKEPTVSNWIDIMKLKDILSEQEMYVRMIEAVSGISKEEILTTDASTIQHIGSIIERHLNNESKEYFPKITHNNIEYTLVDINNISFGQFVDIDTFLNKDESYRLSNLHELAAYLYCESNIEYGKSDFKKRIEAMRDLPLKYVEGSLFFLLNLEKALHELIPLYSKSKLMWAIMNLRITLASFGAGIRAYLSSAKTKSGKLIGLLTLVLLPVLTIYLMFMTLIKKKKK